jgi:pimeloyl-ACP methyl ester carboxylesterase
MRCTEYGCATGKPVVYFHGVPGAPSEAAVLDEFAQQQGLRVLCFERFAAGADLDGDAYYRQLAAAIDEKVAGASVDFIGFSIGTHVALETACRLPGRVKNIHLVAAVAPLEHGNFLDAMAGKAVFTLAQRQPWLFKLLARWQAFLAPRFAPTLRHMLFASAQGQDQELASQQPFQQFIEGVLAESFSRGVNGYCRDIQLFLAPWSPAVFSSETSVHLWHGSDDNWSPIGMADSLAATLPGASGVHRSAGLSHYSCLYDAAPKICRELAVG